MNTKKYFTKDLLIFASVVLLILVIFSATLFGMTGVRFIIGLIMMWLPFYFILCNFKLSLGEKFVFSLLLGITVSPTIAFALGFVMPFTIAIFVVFFILMGVSIGIEVFKK